MQFKTYIQKDKPVFVYIHGECLSAFSFKKQIKELKKDFTLILPIIDGHNRDSEFHSIEECAREILNYIDEHFHGHIQVLAGFSMGGQIVTTMLSLQPDLCEFAMIESAMMQPVKIRNWSAYVSEYLPKLSKIKWFNKFMYYTIFSDDYAFEDYYQNYKNMREDSLKRILNATYSYTIPKNLNNVTGKVAILVGQRERKSMKKSANLLKEACTDSQIFMLMNYNHGDFSLGNPIEYLRFVKSWVQNKDIQQKRKMRKLKEQQEGEYMPNWKHLLNKIKQKKEMKKASS